MQVYTQSIHRHTTTLTAIDPRGLPVRAVGYWRDNDDVALRLGSTARSMIGRGERLRSGTRDCF